MHDILAYFLNKISEFGGLVFIAFILNVSVHLDMPVFSLPDYNILTIEDYAISIV